MKKFIQLYLLSLGLLFALFYAPTNPLAIVVNRYQTDLTLYLLGLFLEPGQLQGIDIWINPHYKIIINQACNGFIPIFFLWAAIIAYPSSFAHKLIWTITGYVVFVAVNTFRILTVVHFTQKEGGQGNFYWSHDLLGNILLIATGLLLFIVFIKSSRKE
jgi:exosortase/archaeosortase family protein